MDYIKANMEQDGRVKIEVEGRRDELAKMWAILTLRLEKELKTPLLGLLTIAEETYKAWLRKEKKQE